MKRSSWLSALGPVLLVAAWSTPAAAQCPALLNMPGACASRTLLAESCPNPADREGEYVQARAGQGICVAPCAAGEADLEAATCVDGDWLGSLCGTLERIEWDQDTAALGMLREAEDDPDALLPEGEITSTCFGLVQQRQVSGVVQERRVPGCANIRLDDGEDPLPCNELAAEGERTTATVIDAGRAGQQAENTGASWYGVRRRHWALASRSSGPAPIVVDPIAAQRAAWDANGITVESCPEYVYEKYYDYSLYEDRVADLGGDYRAAFDAAYITSPPADYIRRRHRLKAASPRSRSAAVRRHGGFADIYGPSIEATAVVNPPRYAIGARGMYDLPLRAKDNTELRPQIELPTAEVPRNVFFSLEEDGFVTPQPFENLTETFQVGPCGLSGLKQANICDEALKDQLNAIMAAPDALVVRDWDWHKRKSDALAEADVLDEDLYAHEQRKEHFSRLLVRRAKIVRDIINSLKRPIPDLEPMPAPFDPNIFINPAEQDAVTQVLARQAGKRAALLQPRALGGRGAIGEVGVGFVEDLLAVERPTANAPPLGRVGVGGGAYVLPVAGVERAGAARKRARASRAEDRALVAQDWDFAGNRVVQANAQDLYSVDPFKSLISALAYTDASIEAALRDALDAGCLETDEANPCDWSPKLFAQEVLDQYSAEREVDFEKCLEVTEGDVRGVAGAGVQVQRCADAGGSPPCNPGGQDIEYLYPTVPESPLNGWPNPDVACYLEADGTMRPRLTFPAGAYTDSVEIIGGELFEDPNVAAGVNRWNRSTSAMDQFFRCQTPYALMFLEALEERFKDAGGDLIRRKPNGCVTMVLAGQKDERYVEGSDDVGADLHYGFGWAIGRWQQYVGGGIAGCDLSPELYGFLDITGKLIGSRFALADASAHVKVGDEEGTEFDPRPGQGDLASVQRDKLHISVILLDQLLDEFPVNENLQIGNPEWNITDDVEYAKTFFEAGATFVIVFVPVSISAGVAGKIGFRYGVELLAPQGQQVGECDIARLAGTFEPYMGVDGFATAGINLLIVEAGVKIALTIVSISLPFRTTLKLSFSGETIDLGAGLSLDLVISMLGGYFAAFVDTFWETYEFPIFKWDGLRFAFNLFDLEETIELVEIKDALELLAQSRPECEL